MRFSEYNPIAITIYFFVVCGIAMFVMNPIILSLALCGASGLFLVLNGRKHGKSHIYYLFLFCIMALINPLVSHNGATVLFVMNHNPVTLEAVLYGLVASLMIVSVLYWFRSFSQIMTSDKLLYVFGACSPKLALILSMALRYVSLLQNQAKKINEAQKVLGLYKEDNIIDDIKGGIRVFSILVTWALENGIITADSMTARGYGIARRSHFSNFIWRKKDVVLVGISVICGGITLIAIRQSTFVYYPRFVAPQLTTVGMCGYVAYGVLCLIPLIIEGKEKIRWSYLRSKI